MGLKRGERKRRREKHFEKILDKKWRYNNCPSSRQHNYVFLIWSLQLTCWNVL